MDRRSWLWRRKSSAKTPGESESSGSISSPSDRFSDEQAYSVHSKQSPEITSKAAPNEESPGKIKALTEKLSAALLNISAKEEIVKQHSKVAEEAVTGWEKAEREVSGLKLQLDAAVKKNSALEDRVGHLDGALKGCVRQLRQAREEQERKIEEVIAKRMNEWELKKSELERQLSELSLKLEAAESEAKENRSLRLDLVALSRKLEVRTLERDFSTKTAESASKQQLESIKKVVKLEAECRRLRSCANKASDSRSDCTERELNEREPSQSGLRASSSDNILMDDFLEMERIVALPVKGNKSLSPENALKAELETMINRIADLEDKIEKLEAEKRGLGITLSESEAHLEASKRQMRDTEEKSLELENRLNECQAQIKASEGQLKATKIELKKVQNQLTECQDQLRMSQAKLNAAENDLIELQTQLIEREDQLTASEGQIKDSDKKLAELQAQLALTCKLKQDIEGELESETISLQAKINSLENELSQRDLEPHFEHPVSCKGENKAVQEKELALAAGKLADCQKTIESLGKQLKSLATLDDFLVDSSIFTTSELMKVPCIDCQ